MLKDILIKFTKDLFFPAFCMGCGKEGAFVCEKCIVLLKRNRDMARIKPVEDFALDGILAVFNYEERALPARLIHAFKYDLIKELKAPLGLIMGDQLNLLIDGDVDFRADAGIALCPVPLHRKREKWRGFNQSELLAQKVMEVTGIEMINPLTRIHFRSPQMALHRGERALNIKGAFTIKPNERALEHVSAYECVFLIDDVATTLGTLNECALTLKEAGYRRVYAIVLARVA